MKVVKKGRVWLVLDGEKELYRGKARPNLDNFKKEEKKAAPKRKPAAKKAPVKKTEK